MRPLPKSEFETQSFDLVIEKAAQSLAVPTAHAAQSVSSFINSLGVGAHIDSGNAQWTNAPLLLQELEFLGISNVRDGTPFDYALPTFITLAQAGIRFNLMEANVWSFDQTGIVNATIDVGRAHLLEAAVPGSIISFEGTNEYTTSNFYLDGVRSTGNLDWGLADAAQLEAAVRADPLFQFTPIIAPSAIQLDSLPDFSAFVDGANAHIYGNVGEQLQDRIVNSIAFAQASAPGQPVYITEIGISSSGYGTSNWGVTDEDTQAIINLNALLGGFYAGAEKTFIYILMDEPNAANIQEQHFGLFRADGTPKPAAVAISNLTQLLHDDGTGTAPLGTLDYLLTGLPEGASSMLLQKSDGTFDLIVWNGRAELYNGSQEVTPPAATITLALAHSAASIQLFDPLAGTDAFAGLANASTVSFQLSAAPVVIQIDMSGPPLVEPTTSNVTWQSGNIAHITGTAEANSMVSIYDGTAMLGSATADASGNWAVNITASGSATRSFNLVAVTPSGAEVASAGDTLYGKGKQTLTGGAGDDVLIGASGNRLFGGAGDDRFVINAGSGKEAIADFQAGAGTADRIHIDDHLAADFASVMAHAQQVGNNVVLSLSRTDVVTLENVSLTALHADDFFFF